MPRIEDYAIVGDTQTVALIARDGSIDWLSIPRFDSAACFNALLGKRDDGRWKISPRAPPTVSRRYLPETLILETTFRTDGGAVRILDFLPPRDATPDVVRIVEGLEGEVECSMDLVIRFEYGTVVPWVRTVEGELHAVGGPDALCLRTPIETHGEGAATVANFTVKTGDRVPFILSWHPSHQPPPPALDAFDELAETERWWHRWSKSCSYDGPWREAVTTSLLVLKALTYAPTGGIVAAPTTSLPEWPGGERNWDYRYCWLRDATLTLYALMLSGYKDEAKAWREWLLRAVAGDPSKLQIMYGVAGERWLPERELSWLDGFEGSKPVRVGNAASKQLQLDVYGEVVDALYQARRIGIPPDGWTWPLQTHFLHYLEEIWREPDSGIWEVRGPPRHFTHSKVMAWVAFDRMVKTVEETAAEGPVEKWREIRDEIHREVCEKGFDKKRNTFTQYYGSKELDASLLVIPAVGFLPPHDPRVRGTIAAIEQELVIDGFVRRYLPKKSGKVDGLSDDEGVFLACNFWLADSYALDGRFDEARALFERLLALRNDVGLLAEEYDPRSGRLLGNFPQALSHLALVATAFNLTKETAKPAEMRSARG